MNSHRIWVASMIICHNIERTNLLFCSDMMETLSKLAIPLRFSIETKLGGFFSQGKILM